MDWDKLKIFHAVAQAGSFTSAGEMLGLSQSAVSRQIGTLEESLGVMLFHRHARGLILTEQGEILQKTASDVARQLQVLEGRLADTRRLPEGPLTITISDFIGSTWLTPRLKMFRELYPNIQVTVLFDEKVLNIAMREADVALRLHEPKQPDLIARKLTTINFQICASKDYVSKNGAPKTLEDLKNHCLIAFPPGSFSAVPQPDWLFNIAGVTSITHPNMLMMNSMYAIHKAVQSGVGIAVLPEYLIAPKENIQIVLPDYKRPPVDMYFAYAEERRNSKRITAFRDFLMKSINTKKS